MAYISRRGRRPMENASKVNQSYIIRQPEARDFLKRCNFPQAAEESVISQQIVPIEFPEKSPTDSIIAIDGGFQETEVRKEFPTSYITFFNFGALFFKASDLDDLRRLPFILPEDMKKLRDMQRAKPFILPTCNVSLDGRTLTNSVRLAVFEFFTKSEDPPLMETLRWLLFENYNRNKPSQAYSLSTCPHCKATKIRLFSI